MIEVGGVQARRVLDRWIAAELAGAPEHRDLYLTPDEQAANDQFLPCCSHARSARLVLDV